MFFKMSVYNFIHMYQFQQLINSDIIFVFAYLNYTYTQKSYANHKLYNKLCPILLITAISVLIEPVNNIDYSIRIYVCFYLIGNSNLIFGRNCLSWPWTAIKLANYLSVFCVNLLPLAMLSILLFAFTFLLFYRLTYSYCLSRLPSHTPHWQIVSVYVAF